ncbi:caprin-2 isoform X5 [Lacerta agilis]|uniref:caprin-2 isoform X5 n=1 Tax=Lacerta agilis TaxID=80427 RepID=UPI0014198011|nr:caprin-2 isoform X5 [Lacerta agilis]
MVQLSQSPLCRTSPSCHSEEAEEKSMKPAKQQVTQGPHGDNQPPLSPLQAALSSAATASQAYETYIDNGLICMKHKIRNIEKKKLKLEDYRDRLKKGEPLNQDQLMQSGPQLVRGQITAESVVKEAVEKYDEVIHNLEFAKDLQKTFSGLSQDLLKAQKKAQRRESIMKLEAEKKKLRTVLQVQYVLQSFTQEHVQRDFKCGFNGAIFLPSKELDCLIRFAKLTCSGRNEGMSVEDQMEQSSRYFWDLLEGSEKTVAGTTYKCLKDLLSKLLSSSYFEKTPAPSNISVKEESKELSTGPELCEEMQRPEKTRQLSDSEHVSELEPQMDHIQSEIQPQEFLNRHYLPEAASPIKKPEESKPWEMEHVKTDEPLKSWEMLVDMEEQEQKKQKQDYVKTLESLRQQGKKLELSKPWEAHLKEGGNDHKEEVPKPWVTQVREQRDSPKHWMSKAKEEQEQKPQGPKTWVAQIRVETVQKPEPVKLWSACVGEEKEQKKHEPAKQWVAHIKEEREQKTQPPKVWETSEGPRQALQKPLQNPPKIWGAGNLTSKEQSGPKKPDLGPNEDGKTDGVNKGGIDATSVGEPCKLPRIFENSLQAPKPVHQPAAEFCSTSLPKDPVLRRERLQDLMTQIQGTYNFMQESLLDFDKPSQRAICSSQAPSVDSTAPNEQLSSQNDFPEELVQVAASPITLHGSTTSLTSDNTLSGSETELATPQTPVTNSQESENFSPPQSLYQINQEISEVLMPQKSEISQVPIPLSSESQTSLTPSRTTMSPVPQGKGFQSPSPSSSISMKAPPFQAVQIVFKVNAPLPPRREHSLHPAGYNQNFCTASTQTPPQCKPQSTQNVEQTAFSQDALPNAQTTTFPRPAQPFVTSRGSVRGTLRGARSATNSYRSPGGYKAGFEVYRGSPPVPNGLYSQMHLPGRDYPSVQYPHRDLNYQQNYKRGGISSGRATSRAGWSDSSQVSSPERDSETFDSGDSGQGDSRSITPVDMPVMSQATTFVPLHIYAFPQQTRTAFSATRTSNFTPGTLDQPITFDLLLHNLGEAFNIHLGRFSCPVNGTYVFFFNMLKLAVNVPLYVNLMKNEEILVSAYANDGAPDHETASNHAVLQLFQGDQIWLRLHRGAIYGSSWKYSTFSGFVLYQD